MSPTRYIKSEAGIGDAILLTPALAACKRAHPTTRLVVFCLVESHRDIFRHNPDVDRVLLAHTRGRRLAWRVLLGSRWKHAIRTDCWRYRPHRAVRLPSAQILGEVLGVPVSDLRPRLFLTREEREFGTAFVQRAGGGQPAVAVHLDTASAQNKEWPAAYWDELIASTPGVKFIQLGGPNGHRLGGDTITATGLPLRRSFAVLAACNAFVGIDSCLAHAAAAFSVPGVVLFGASSQEVYGQDSHRNLNARVSCAPCYDVLGFQPCPLGKRCMTAIPPALVQAQLQAIAARSR